MAYSMSVASAAGFDETRSSHVSRTRLATGCSCQRFRVP